MIKVNLLNSVTDVDRSVAVVEERVSDPRTRFFVLLTAVFGLMALVMVFDYVSANSANTAAQAELEKQKQIAAQMAVINAEQAELQKRIGDIQVRIDARRSRGRSLSSRKSTSACRSSQTSVSNPSSRRTAS